MDNPSQATATASDRWLAAGVAVFLLLAWFTPDHYLPWPSFHAEVFAATAGLLAAVLLLTHKIPRPSASATLLAAVALLPAMQWAFGQVAFAGDALLASAYVAAAAICLWIGGALPRLVQTRLLFCLAWAFLCAAIASTGVGLYQWFGLEGLQIWAMEGVPGRRIVGNLAQPNHLATLLLLALLATVWLRAQGRLGNGSTVVVAGFLALGLGFTQSRTPWLALVLLGVWAIVRREALWAPLRVHPIAVVGFAGVYALSFWLALVLPTELLLAEVMDTGRLQAGLRPLLWSQMLEAIQQAPWLGYGWQQGLTAQADAALVRPGMEYASYAHNLALDLMLWNGVPLGLLIFAALLAWYLKRGWSARGADDAFRFGVLTCLAAHSMVEYPFAYLYFLVPVALLAGQLERRKQVVAPVGEAGSAWLLSRGMRTAVLAGVACLGVSLLVASVRDYALVEADRRIVQMQMSRIGGERVLPPAPKLWVLDQLAASLEGARVQPRPNMTSDEIEALLRTARRHPGVYFLRQAVYVLVLNGREPEALIELKRLRGMHGDDQFQLALLRMSQQEQEGHQALQRFAVTARQRLSD